MALSLKTKFGYGVGHVLNDLCVTIWFSYLLLYYHHVLLFPSPLEGVVLLIGQVADAVSTPYVGYEADRIDDLPICVKYGRRKTWHLIGTICVLSSFAFIFLSCFGCTEITNPWAKLLYFLPFVIIFQFGWACSQISHMAILPNLSADPHDRTELNAIRYGFTMVATIAVYCITWLVLGVTSTASATATAPAPKDGLSPKDELKFVTLVLIILGIGAIFSVIFHLLVEEKNDSYIPLEYETEEKPHRIMMWKDWLREPEFYQIALIYMATRQFGNLSQVYMPIYLEDTLLLDEKSIAYIPLVMYVSGFATTIVMKPLNRIAGRRITFLIGSAIGTSGALWVYFGHGLLYETSYIYVVAMLIGSGSSIMLVTALSLSADMIGNNVESGGFVYGSLSFTDKLSNGLVVMIIQYFSPRETGDEQSKNYFRDVIVYACGSSIILGVLGLFALMYSDIGRKKFSNVLDWTPSSSTSEWTPSPSTSTSVPQSSTNSWSGNNQRKKSDYFVLPVTEEKVNTSAIHRYLFSDSKSERRPLLA